MTDKAQNKEKETPEVAEEQTEQEVMVVPDEEPESIVPEAPADAESAPEAGAGFDEKKKMELFKGVSFRVTVELGRKIVTFGEVLDFGKGSVIELDKLADDPVDIYVNQSKIAEGEVVVVDDYFGVRITKLLEKNPGS